MQGPIPLATAQQSANNDARITREAAIEPYELMCRAAQSAFLALTQHWTPAHKVYIVAGKGNNGGDGYVLGRLLLAAGYSIEVFAFTGVPTASPADYACQSYQEANGKIHIITERMPAEISQQAVVVDALFGSGLNKAPQGLALKLIEWMNTLDCPTLALDIPSGLSADSGAVLSQAVHAQLTVTFIVRKIGLYTGAGREYCGEIVYADLQLPSEYTTPPDANVCLMDATDFHPLVKVRADMHKKDFGHVLVIGGDHGMGGAVCLASTAAMRCGAGLASVATRRLHIAPVLASCCVVMAHAVEQLESLDALCSCADVLVIGPGLGTEQWGTDLFSSTIERPVFKVVDASALTLLAYEPQFREDWILTPHPGEAARLLGTNAQAVQDDRIAASHEIVRRFGGVCILKGSGTIVCSKQGTAVCPRGSVALATAGSGDVLSGVVAALLAQSLASNKFATQELATLYEVSVRAVYLHAWVGEVSAQQHIRSTLASDFLVNLPDRLNKLNIYAPAGTASWK